MIFQVDTGKKNLDINEFLNMGGDRDIIKHSKNIIDLIEVGDYVNGYLVGGISDNGGTAEKEIMIEIPYEKTYNKHALNEKIKTILTHEMYEQNCYKVGED